MDSADLNQQIIEPFSYSSIKTLHLEPTTRCNAGCPQCSRYITGTETLNPMIYPTELKLVDFRRIESLISQLNKMYMCGTFGDPAASYDCLKILEYFREVNPSITLGMNTNGSIRNKKFWTSVGKLFNKVEDYVVFSIDGLEDTNHIYRKNTQFSKIIENATSFIEAGGRAHWDMLLFEHNEHQLHDAIGLAKDLGFSFFRYKVSRRFNSKPVVWLNPPKEYQHQQILNSNISCQAVKDESIYLDAFGNLLPCCFIGNNLYTDSDTSMHHYDMGNYNIRNNSVEEILKMPLFDDIIDRWNNDPYYVCKNSCSMIDNKTEFTSQWKYEINLSE